MLSFEVKFAILQDNYQKVFKTKHLIKLVKV